MWCFRDGKVVEVPWTAELLQPVGHGQSFLKQLPFRFLDLGGAVQMGSSRPASQPGMAAPGGTPTTAEAGDMPAASLPEGRTAQGDPSQPDGPSALTAARDETDDNNLRLTAIVNLSGEADRLSA